MFFSGMLLMLGSFIPYAQSWKEDVAVWFDILAAIAFILGGGNLLKMHLKKISNWQAGWGYSAVTLLAFTITLIVGMLKFGVPPAVQAEQYGAIAVPLPLSAFPQVATVDGQLPHGEFPPSVKHQLTADSATETVSFRGWLTESQRSQLKDFEREAGWHKTVDELFAKAQPPQEVRDRVGYHAVLETLHFAGVMTDAGRNALQGLSDDPRWLTAVEEIDKQSHRAHSVPLEQLPEGILVPDELEQVVEFDPVKRELRIIGPMSPKQRDTLANQFPAGTALTPQQKEQLREKLEGFGTLSSIQVERLNEFDDEKPTTGQRNKE
jgi:Spy/CpxP family protein refolding chaperone